MKKTQSSERSSKQRRKMKKVKGMHNLSERFSTFSSSFLNSFLWLCFCLSFPFFLFLNIRNLFVSIFGIFHRSKRARERGVGVRRRWIDGMGRIFFHLSFRLRVSTLIKEISFRVLAYTHPQMKNWKPDIDIEQI